MKSRCLFHLFIFMTIATGNSPAAHQTGGEQPPRERYAALECQNDFYLVLVNFYYGQLFKLTAGEHELTEIEDMPVTRSFQDGQEIFKGERIHLALPASHGNDSLAPRVGTYTSNGGKSRQFGDLHCLIHAAD